jgi:putative transposase
MSNHYHLYLCTPQANIAKVMKFINQSYAIYFLAKYPEKDGHVFKGRYKKKIVQTDKYSKTLINYIHNNPVVANLSTNLAAYPWSSYSSFINPRERYDFIDYSWVLDQFGQPDKQIKRFKEFHQENSDSDWCPRQEAKAQIFLADDSFIKSICDQYLDFDKLEGKPINGLSELKAIYNRANIIEVINSLDFKADTNAKITAYLLREYTDITIKGIGELLNKSDNAVWKILQRFRNLIKNDQELELEIRKLVEMSDGRIRP